MSAHGATPLPDPATLAAAFDAHAPALVLYARQIVPPGIAEDIVQDAFLRLMAQPRAVDNVKAWLFATVRHAALDAARADRRRDRRHRAVAAAAPQTLEADPAAPLDAATAAEALAALPQDVREVIVLRVWAQMTFQDIAATQGVPLSAAYRMYQSGLEQLRLRLENPCRKTT